MAQLEVLTRRLLPLLQIKTPLRYVVAIAAVTVTTSAQQVLLQHKPSTAPFVLSFLAVAVVSSMGGAVPGLFAVAVAAVAANHFFIEPLGSWPKPPQAFSATLLFLAAAIPVALLCAFLRRTWIVLSHVQRDLERAQHVAHVGSWRLRLRSNQLLWSDETHRMFGVPLGSPLSYETFRECVHPDDRALVESAWQAALRGAPYDIEHRILASGAPKWVHERAELEFDDDGALRSGFGTVQDITERKRAQEAVRASEERFRTMFESSAVAIAQLDLETGSIEKVNQRFADLIGRPAAELEGGDYAALLRAAERPQASAGIQAAKAGKLKGDFRWVQTFLRADGSVAETEVFGTVLQDSAARPVAATLIIVDVTERNLIVRELAASRVVSEEAKAAAEEASRAKDHFLAVLSHELRTPLSPVLTGISLLEREGLSAHGRHIVQVIRRNVELEAHLIDDLLDLTRIARGRIELELERVDVCTVIDRAVEVCRPDIEARRLHFGVDYGPRPHMVDVDPARLQQVLWNLLKNAIKFTPKNGCVGLRCSRPQDGELLLEVNDSGIGIESAAIPTIFDAFVREDRKGRHPYGGLGLGLAISKSLVLLHGGRIEAESEGSDKGATFRVYLPLATLDTAAGNERHRLESAASTAETTMPLRVLLVEDHGDTAETMVAVLSLVGHEVATAGDAATAMGLLERESFDLLISDLGLPDLSGIELVQRLRATGCTVPAIALSGYGLESDILRSREAGFAAHLVKPVDPSRLFEVMERVARSAG